jgi:hypothetical protein
MDMLAASGIQLHNGLVNGQTPARSSLSSFSLPLTPLDQLSEVEVVHRRRSFSTSVQWARPASSRCDYRSSTLVDCGVLFAVQ